LYVTTGVNRKILCTTGVNDKLLDYEGVSCVAHHSHGWVTADEGKGNPWNQQGWFAAQHSQRKKASFDDMVRKKVLKRQSIRDISQMDLQWVLRKKTFGLLTFLENAGRSHREPAAGGWSWRLQAMGATRQITAIFFVKCQQST
jgi:hypothetical protein